MLDLDWCRNDVVGALALQYWVQYSGRQTLCKILFVHCTLVTFVPTLHFMCTMYCTNVPYLLGHRWLLPSSIIGYQGPGSPCHLVFIARTQVAPSIEHDWLLGLRQPLPPSVRCWDVESSCLASQVSRTQVAPGAYCHYLLGYKWLMLPRVPGCQESDIPCCIVHLVAGMQKASAAYCRRLLGHGRVLPSNFLWLLGYRQVLHSYHPLLQ